jgi:UDP-N-acetylglucosamine acyltransferase
MNSIHPSAIVEPSVQLGQNNYIGPFCIITGDTVIGDNNTFISHCSIGQQAEHKTWFDRPGKTIIGNNNRFSEFVTVHRGTETTTRIGSNCIFLRASHIGHDCIIHDGVTISCSVLLGGHTIVHRGSNLGLGSITHQFSVIGAFTMLGMGTIVPKTKRIEPAKIYVGNPAEFLKENLIGLERNGVDDKTLTYYKNLYENDVFLRIGK